jgi:hypothetical protein
MIGHIDLKYWPKIRQMLLADTLHRAHRRHIVEIDVASVVPIDEQGCAGDEVTTATEPGAAQRPSLAPHGMPRRYKGPIRRNVNRDASRLRNLAPASGQPFCGQKWGA